MKICVVGGAGYVGSTLVPLLLKKKHEVTVYDSFWYGDHLDMHKNLEKVRADIRNTRLLSRAFKDQDAVIHLACVSNDPSFDLNPGLGKEVNYTSFKPMLNALRKREVNRFIYASSSSVYGVNDSANITEDTHCKPLTDYSKYKLACELELKSYGTGGAWTIVRPATVCGYSPRMRFDLVVNILTLDALLKKRITVHGGSQMRANINIKDMARAYCAILEAPDFKVNEKTYNVGHENMNLETIAHTVRDALKDKDIEIVKEESKDPRSYQINSDRIKEELAFVPERRLSGAVASIESALKFDLFKNPGANPDYVNISKMKELGL